MMNAQNEYVTALTRKMAFHARTAFEHGAKHAKEDPHVDPEVLAKNHWGYVCEVIREHGYASEYLEFAEVYQRAFVAGFLSAVPKEQSKEDSIKWVAENSEPQYRVGKLATGDDTGRMVFVRDEENKEWMGPIELYSIEWGKAHPYGIYRVGDDPHQYRYACIAEQVEMVEEDSEPQPIAKRLDIADRLGPVATTDDCGEDVFVRDNDGDEWQGPFELHDYRRESLCPYSVIYNGEGFKFYRQARLCISE